MITHNEKLFAILVIIGLISVGVVVTSNIKNSNRDKDVQYETALQIKDAENFDYAVNTSVGKVLVEGELKAVQPFHFEDDRLEWFKMKHFEYDCLFYRIDTEEYTMHTITYIDSDGNSQTMTNWTWDVVDKNYYHNDAKLFNQVINTGNIEFKNGKWVCIKTEQDAISSDIRYVYYGVLDGVYGTLCAFTRDKQFYNILNYEKIDKPESKILNFYIDSSIEDTLKSVAGLSTMVVIILWVVIVLLAAIVFYTLWLHDFDFIEDNDRRK